MKEIETTTLDTFCQSESITEIDFIQLDIQGGELPVLEGADWILKSGILGIISEVEFTELYTGQPLFSDLDVYLRMRGFTLFDINHMHRDIRKMPIISSKHPGALIWADAFYFRDLIREDLSINLKTPDKIFKLACIADVLDFTDYALELLTHLTLQYGNDKKYNFADNIIETLAYVPGLVKQGELLASVPIVGKIRVYSSSYKYKTFSIQEDLRKQAYQYLLLGEYDQAESIYEKAIELEPNVKANYWHLGLLRLLQDQELEAHTTWFVGIAEGKPEDIDMWIAELVEVLQAEAERREIIGDKELALTIHENINTIASQCDEHSTNRSRKLKYSYLDEESIIEKYINLMKLESKYCVDIAASDGITMSNTYFLFQRGWSGLAVEYDNRKFSALAAHYVDFPNVNLSKSMVTPDNVISLLKAYQVPENFGLLNLDIDGYDYFVLNELLKSFRPSLICTEINEKIPPPLKFTVKWHPKYVWENNHFYGQSICQLNILCERYDYALVELHYNNAFLIPKELSPIASLTPAEAYQKGYLECPDRKEKFPWNADIEEIHQLSDEQALNYVNNFFAKYTGKFDCYI
jgi:tetratricopeptide (TPR) repeat protein